MSDPILTSNTFKPPEEVSWRDVNGEMVVLKLTSGEYYTFNEVGRITWLALSEGKNIKETVQMVIDEHDVTPEKAKSDVENFAMSLIKQELLSCCD